MIKRHIVEYQSGHESIDNKWPMPKMGFSINAGTLDQEEIEELYQFWWVAGADSFRFEDPWDHKSCSYYSTLAAGDQIVLENPSTSVASVQLIKTYRVGSHSMVRYITKPNAATVVFLVDGSTRTTGFTVNGSTGVATFSPVLASTVASVRAGFEYWVHARFRDDELPITWEGGIIGNAKVNLVEKLEA